jgi:hypothetical protein
MPFSFLPTCICHADWSVQPHKRQLAAAWLQPDGSFIAHAPISVPEPGSLLPELRAKLGPTGCALIGFDFPIGLPYAYAQKTGFNHFTTALQSLGQGQWESFYRVAEYSSEISLQRPFYPARPGHAAQAHLLNALGFHHMDQLRRTCELSHPGRRAAAPLFWTLGGQQVGKAAISGWQEVLTPAKKEHSDYFRIWPFDGNLEDLLQPGRIVAAETYPAEFYAPLQIVFSPTRKNQKSGKRSIQDRQSNASTLIEAARKLQVQLSSELELSIQEGFGAQRQSEDAFDALIGLLGMVMVVHGLLPRSVPLSGTIAAIEGWIFGQSESRSAILSYN